MNTGKKELQSILQELEELKLSHMATKLEELYHQPAFVDTGRLELISAIVHEEYTVAIENRYTSRLQKAKLRGSDNCLDQCVDSKEEVSATRYRSNAFLTEFHNKRYESLYLWCIR